MNKIDDTFLIFATDIIADTNNGLSGSEIVKYCNSFAIEYNKIVPYGKYPFPNTVPNKRTALLENLRVFSIEEQYFIIENLCNLTKLSKIDKVEDLKTKLFQRYGAYKKEKFSETDLVQKTKHWLSGYADSLKQYESALEKYESGVYERNTLDDIRLSFEILVKRLLKNNKSLENQIKELGEKLKNSNCSVELRNMVVKIIEYYTDFQNNHVKHNDIIDKKEIEYVIELTSVVMKFLIKVLEEN